MGRNVAIDQAMEHSIKDTKELMNGQGANLSFSTAQLYSRESDDVKCIMKNFDQENNVRKESTKHQRKQHTDIQIVVDILEEMKAFTEIPGRTHTGIGSVPKDPISVLNYVDLNAWLTKHKKSWIPLL